MRLDTPHLAIVVLTMVFTMIGAGLAAAADPGAGIAPIIDLRGDVVAGNQLRLYIQPGADATRCIRIVSQPSNTVLAVVLDPEYAEQPEGKRLLDKATGAVAVTDLPEGQPALQVPARPAGDDRIAVYVTGDSGEELLVADALVGGGAFHFSTALVEGGPKAGGGFYHCCQGGPCSNMCKTCSGVRFTCCLTDQCCQIYCDWVGNCCQ